MSDICPISLQQTDYTLPCGHKVNFNYFLFHYADYRIVNNYYYRNRNFAKCPICKQIFPNLLNNKIQNKEFKKERIHWSFILNSKEYYFNNDINKIIDEAYVEFLELNNGFSNINKLYKKYIITKKITEYTKLEIDFFNNYFIINNHTVYQYYNIKCGLKRNSKKVNGFGGLLFP